MVGVFQALVILIIIICFIGAIGEKEDNNLRLILAGIGVASSFAFIGGTILL